MVINTEGLLLAPVRLISKSSSFRRAPLKLKKLYFKDTKEKDRLILSHMTCFCHTRKQNQTRRRKSRSKLVWAVFENFALSETLANWQTLDEFSFTSRSTRLQVISLKFRNIQRETPVFDSFFNNVPGLQLYQHETPTQVFCCEYCKIFKNNFFYRTPLVFASVLSTITMLNFNHALENLHTMDDFNFTNFLSDRDGMLYGRCQLLLLSQTCLKQLLSESYIGNFH